MTRVYFIRHAEPDYSNHNDELRPLTPKGMEDRKAVTRFLSDKQIHAVLSSPYKRAVDTVADFAEHGGFAIETVTAFRERGVGCWVADFDQYAKKQWQDFTYKLSGGESLQEVQDRNIAALMKVLTRYPGKNIVIGSHGTALSTILHYFDSSFGYDEFIKIKNVMPWIVAFDFDENGKCVAINQYDLKSTQEEVRAQGTSLCAPV